MYSGPRNPSAAEGCSVVKGNGLTSHITRVKVFTPSLLLHSANPSCGTHGWVNGAGARLRNKNCYVKKEQKWQQMVEILCYFANSVNFERHWKVARLGAGRRSIQGCSIAGRGPRWFPWGKVVAHLLNYTLFALPRPCGCTLRCGSDENYFAFFINSILCMPGKVGAMHAAEGG